MIEVPILSYDNVEIDELVNADKENAKICQACSKLFMPYGKRNRDRLKYCNRIHYSTCPICGKEFLVNLSGGLGCRKKACSRSCSNKLKMLSMADSMMEIYGVKNPGQMSDHQEKVHRTCQEKYDAPTFQQSEEGKKRLSDAWKDKTPEEMQARLDKSIATNMARYDVPNGSQAAHAKEKQMKTNRERHGADWYTQTEEYQEKAQQTFESRYGDKIFFRTKHYHDKVRETSQRTRGVDHFTQDPNFKKKMSDRNMEAWGVSCVFQRPDLRAKAMKRTSNLEIRLHNMLQNYQIEYETEYYIRRDEHSHHFDVFLPKYKILIDVDGIYYHAYVEDPDGMKSRDDYDDVRLYCVPEGFRYVVLIESDFERELRRLQKILQDIDKGIFQYDSEIFKWCRSIGFPYYDYSDKYLKKQFDNLCRYKFDTYRPACEIGISLVQQFHKSIFDCRVGKAVSIREAWDDDMLLKKVIANRLIYQNDVRPSKVLTGFNISKIAPKVSIFNPVLAKYLTQKYLSEFDSVFDPFSGFSGRLLGVAASGKMYIGQDLNPRVTTESNQLINFLDLWDTCSVSTQDIFNSSGVYECLLTCPPYGSKEIYNQETIFKSCDEWIDECISRFKCVRYVFVVDKTDKYQKFIREEIRHKSHFRKSSEYIVVIEP